MKKLLTAIFIVNILAVPCFAISKNASTEEKLEYIKEQSIKMKTKRMERTWENLCEQDPKTCKEKQEWFDDLLYDASVRKKDMQVLMFNLYWNKNNNNNYYRP